jgi:Domain of unknown function (DUF4386)
MTTMIRTTTAVRAPSDPMRRNVFIAGVLYLITFAASIPALILLHPVLDDSTYIISSGSDTRVLWGCLLDMVNALAAVGTKPWHWASSPRACWKRPSSPSAS